MNRSIDDLLTIVTTNGDLANLDNNIVDICQVLEQAVSQFRTLSDKHQVDIQLKFSEHKIPVLVQYQILLRIMNKLIENVIMMTQAESRVQIEASVKHPEDGNAIVVIKVVDGGESIQYGDMVRILSNRPDEPPISGLGINGGVWAEIKSSVEEHGGKIWVENDDNRVVTFSLELPLADMELPLHQGESKE